MRTILAAVLLSTTTFGLSTISSSVLADVAIAELTYPTKEASLGTTQQFWWEHAEGADAYWLMLRDAAGNTYGDYTVHPQGTYSTVLHNLPDQPLTAELFTIVNHRVNGDDVQNWDRVAYYHLNASPAIISSPSSNQLNGSTATFSWNAVAAADDYYLQLTDNAGNWFFGDYSNQQTSVTVDNLPVDQRQLNVTLYTLVGNSWDRRHTSSYTAARNDAPPVAQPELPPFQTDFDYQIGGAYTPASNVGIVSRDYTVNPAAGVYNICYVNAFQSQPGEQSSWPAGAVTPLYDEDWDEFLIDIRTASARQSAASFVYTMIDNCAASGYDAVEFDNLDTFARLGNSVDAEREHTEYWFEMSDAVAFATLLTDYTHNLGLASAQKNTAELFPSGAHRDIGFDFAIVEDCLGEDWNECESFASNYNDKIMVIQYEQFDTVCADYGNRFPIVEEDIDVVYANTAGSFCN